MTELRTLRMIAGTIVLAVVFLLSGCGAQYHGPADGTALCKDGTISYSQHAQGTCSWHGGVKAWNDYGAEDDQ